MSIFYWSFVKLKRDKIFAFIDRLRWTLLLDPSVFLHLRCITWPWEGAAVLKSCRKRWPESTFHIFTTWHKNTKNTSRQQINQRNKNNISQNRENIKMIFLLSILSISAKSEKQARSLNNECIDGFKEGPFGNCERMTKCERNGKGKMHTPLLIDNWNYR